MSNTPPLFSLIVNSEFVHVKSCWVITGPVFEFVIDFWFVLWDNLCSAAVSVNLEVFFSFASQFWLFIFLLFDFLFYHVSPLLCPVCPSLVSVLSFVSLVMLPCLSGLSVCSPVPVLISLCCVPLSPSLSSLHVCLSQFECLKHVLVCELWFWFFFPVVWLICVSDVNTVTHTPEQFVYGVNPTSTLTRDYRAAFLLNVARWLDIWGSSCLCNILMYSLQDYMSNSNILHSH